MSLPRIALQRSGIVEEWEKEDDPRRIAYMGKRQARLEQVDGAINLFQAVPVVYPCERSARNCPPFRSGTMWLPVKIMGERELKTKQNL